jgi:hypothetical protein
MVVDGDDPGPAPDDIRVLSRPTLMIDAAGRRELAEATLAFAGELRSA